MSANSSKGEILTIKRVEYYLKGTKRTIHMLAAAKLIPVFKIAGTWSFSRIDIDSWIKQRSMGGLGSGCDGNGAVNTQTSEGELKECLD